MGYDLTNINGESTGFSSPMWNEILWIGKNWGWKPEGTYRLKDEDAYWDDGLLETGEPFGPYTGNNAQVVTTEDANSWADALESALADKKFSEIVTAYHMKTKLSYEQASDDLTKIVLWNFKENEYRSTLRDFLSFLRKGTFVII